ncbi:multiple inositol polyphosphate phosphatase 1-like [Eucyclogobius newberryi]|uniref:multiple inositol polyphosphate phosphatase 1-like n=1 Tax=Eucyclogobius newberryi TaxID=166745 RepID=UPI003B59868E
MAAETETGLFRAPLLRAILPGHRLLRAGTGCGAAPGVSSLSLPGHRLLFAAALLLLTGHCGGSVPDIAMHFGTKTRYEDVVRLGRNLSVPGAEGCSPVHLTAVIRHGTRFPTVKNVRRIARLSALLRDAARGHAASARLRDIQDQWEQWYTEDMDGQLVDKGRTDLSNLAMRLAGSFPALLTEAELRGGRIDIKTSSKHRCVSSAEAFQDGLHQVWARARETGAPGARETGTESGTEAAERDQDQDLEYVHEVDDALLRSFERCRGYVEGVETNATATEEVERFKQGAELRGVRTRVSEKLGLAPDLLSPDLVEAAFFICSYELAVKSLDSPFCRLFTKEDAMVLEYKGDLKQYWKRAHGHTINGLSSCPLFHHIFRTLDKAGRPRRATDTPPEPASVLIGHAETLLPLIALLGLYKDKTTPTATNYQSQRDRVFRSSHMVPYAANLLFVLYDCPRGPRLSLLVNESPVPFPGLSHDLPLYRDVRAAYRHLLDGCDFYSECEGRRSRAPNTEL